MDFDKSTLKNSLIKCEQVMGDYNLPVWNELPPIDLYMDQVIMLLNQYLSQGEDSKEVTPAMINNYVKMKLIPPPIRKKYSRVHIACLLMICALKPIFNISTIQKLLPDMSDQDLVLSVYNSFVNSRVNAKDASLKYIRHYTRDHIDNNYIMELAVYSAFLKRFAEKTIDIYFADSNELCDEQTENNTNKAKD